MPAPSAKSPANAVWTKLGYKSSRELIAHFPRRYEDRSRWEDPFLCKLDQAVTVQGEVLATKSSRWRGGRSVFEVTLQPEGFLQELNLTWFNMPFMKNVFKDGDQVVLFGKISENKNGRRMIHPEYEVIKKDDEPRIHLNRVTPVYSLVSGVYQKTVRAAIYAELFSDELKVPEFYQAPEKFMSRLEAVRKIHFPESMEELEPARRRLAHDELMVMQTVMAVRRQRTVRQRKDRPAPVQDLVPEFLNHLGFEPTGAQDRVFGEIDEDLSENYPMHRLIQGDVGSGKTIVAAYALVRCLESGKNGAMLAPTETLATQHADNLRKILSPLGVEVVLWTRTSKPADGASLFPTGKTVYVGTHALIQEGAVLENLGLGVIDEQHKFGVAQRHALMQKGEHPDLLVMTATPIPRTLCLTYYGDLDVSVLDEMPPGRKPVKTVLRARKDLKKVWKFIQEESQHGRQAYVVYPLLEESEKLDAKSVQEAFTELKGIFGEDQVVMLHGKLDSEEKQQRMQEFRQRKFSVMVATSVIEVGVDNPNASMMVIENAERFGLAQLHQLRGRVGRGQDQAYCVLVGEPKNEDGWKRLEVMEQTGDGFEIAEADLQIRGPGDILGTEQSGFPLKIVNLIKDMDMIESCRRLAQNILDEDPDLSHHKGLYKRIKPFIQDSEIKLGG
ncbi:MAG: ATP-dependent DNA helicase RecG [Verrucomicrobiota bacterium]